MTRSTSETVRQLSEILKANRFAASGSLENVMGYLARGFFFYLSLFFIKMVRLQDLFQRRAHISAWFFQSMAELNCAGNSRLLKGRAIQ